MWSGDTVFASTYFEHALSLFWFGSEIVKFVFPWILDKINAHNNPIAPPPWTRVLHSFSGFFDASTANNTAWYETAVGSATAAAVAEPTAVSYHAVLLAVEASKKPLNECRTLVQGGGAIGLLCALILSKIQGNTNLTISDPNQKRLNACSKYVDAKTVSPDHKDIKESSCSL